MAISESKSQMLTCTPVPCKADEEASYYQQHAKRPPRFSVPGNKELSLLRDVRIPDEHVLAEPDVGPENAEGQHPLPHDVVMLNGDDVLQVSSLSQGCDDQNEQ